jgi:L-methionine (R)-S-oxide reductase
MSEGLLLEPLSRGTLLPEAERTLRLQTALPQIQAVLEGEVDPIAVQSTLACLLWDTLAQCNWCGFYRVVAPGMLAVGPYQGGMGCLRIPFERGVCGAAARTLQSQFVPDVHAFPGHIACDSASRSELVIPIVAGGELRAVLDLDSTHPSGFSLREKELLEAFLGSGWMDRLAW